MSTRREVGQRPREGARMSSERLARVVKHMDFAVFTNLHSPQSSPRQWRAARSSNQSFQRSHKCQFENDKVAPSRKPSSASLYVFPGLPGLRQPGRVRCRSATRSNAVDFRLKSSCSLSVGTVVFSAVLSRCAGSSCRAWSLCRSSHDQSLGREVWARDSETILHPSIVMRANLARR